MLDRYVQDSADNAHQSSQDGSYASDSEDEADSTSGSDEADSDNDKQSSATKDSSHLARLKIDSAADSNAGTDVHGLSADDPDQQARGSAAEPELVHEPQHGVSDTCADSQQPGLDMPDHVAVRASSRGPRAVPCGEDEQDLDESSVLSHTTQVPSQAAVKQRVLDQQRSRMRRQVLARASRNAQKVGNKKERKQTADSVNW